MKYTQGKLGRVFVLRLEEGEVIHEVLERFARDVKLTSATITIIGAANKGSKLVVGPKNGSSMPPAPMEKTLEEVHELTGVGTIFLNENGDPVLHMHVACGREGGTITGCVRRGVKVWQMAEVVMTELVGVNARREMDARTGFELLNPRCPTINDLTRHAGER